MASDPGEAQGGEGWGYHVTHMTPPWICSALGSLRTLATLLRPQTHDLFARSPGRERPKPALVRPRRALIIYSRFVRLGDWLTLNVDGKNCSQNVETNFFAACERSPASARHGGDPAR